MNRFLYWVPRVLSVMFVIFLSLFALEAFSGHQGLAIFPSFLLGLLPACIVLLVTVMAWKWDFAGALLFFVLAISYVWMVGLDRDWTWYASISGPEVMIGIFFFLNWSWERTQRK